MPFRPLLVKNSHLDFLGSDDFGPEAKAQTAQAVNRWVARRRSPPRGCRCSASYGG